MTIIEVASNVRSLKSHKAPTWANVLRRYNACNAAYRRGDEETFDRLGDMWDDITDDTMENGNEIDRLRAFVLRVAEFSTDDNLPEQARRLLGLPI